MTLRRIVERCATCRPYLRSVSRLTAYCALRAPMPPATSWQLAWPYRCDVVPLARLQARSASGEMAADFAVLDAIEARVRAARDAANVKRIAEERARLGLDAPGRGGGDPVGRASRYLATLDGDSSASAFRAALALVRGFALDEGTALTLLLTEYAPRYHRALPRAELIGMVRRASRATGTGYGWLLADRKKAG